MRFATMKIAVCAGAYDYFIVIYDLMAELKMPKPEHVETAEALVNPKGKGRGPFDFAFVDYDLLRDLDELLLMKIFESAPDGVIVMFAPSDVDKCDDLFALGMKDFLVKNYAHTKLKNRMMEIWETLRS